MIGGAGEDVAIYQVEGGVVGGGVGADVGDAAARHTGEGGVGGAGDVAGHEDVRQGA